MTNIQKAIKVLSLLEFGMKLTIGNFKLALGEDEKGRDRVCVVMQHFMDDEKPEDKLMTFDMSLDGFIHMMRHVTEDNINIWSAEKVLTEINRKKR